VPATSTLTIFRVVPATQTTQYQEGGDFPAASHERALDKLTFISQQNARAVQRSLRVTEGSGEKNEVVAVPNTLIGLDSSNQPKALTVSEIKSLLAISGTTLSVPAGIKTFADAGERALGVPEFTGQLGTQRDTADIYISTGTTAGDWSLVEENMSLADFASGFFTADATGRGKFGSGFVDAALLASNAVETAKINDAAVTFAKQQSPQYTGFRNAIINGNFDIWQRGTSFNTLAYGADRWLNWMIGSSCTMTRQNFTLGQTDVPNEPTHFCRMAVTSSAGASNNVSLMQLIEGVRRFAGQTMTVSFYAKADAAKPIAVSLLQFFGTGGSPSSSVATYVTKTTLSTSWQKVTATVAVPSITGKTIGDNGDDRLTVAIIFDAGSALNADTNSLGQQSGTFDIAQVQVEQGSVATPFEARPIGAELALCQRYYQTGAVGAVSYASSGASVQRAFANFGAQMRSVPTVTLSVNSGALTVPASLGQFTNGFVLSFGSTAAGEEGTFNWTASAEL
jgi:hypothetical protein